ncbi:MAG: transposase [Candidatus Levybacteria bacterium]|nr:transposase [Candidatus Levybacteria bacterium]
MPYRKIPIAIGETYHVFNRSVAQIPLFTSTYDYVRALALIQYYRYGRMPVSYSHFKRLALADKDSYMKSIKKQQVPIVEIIAYCIMPTHVHFMLQSKVDKGISTFMRNFQHSYSKYFNTKYSRHGALFQDMFKAVRIGTDEQLLHVSRYIHLNPVTDYIVEIDALPKYTWSSYGAYLNPLAKTEIINCKSVMSHFSSPEQYESFMRDQVDYQRSLANLKHLIV